MGFVILRRNEFSTNPSLTSNYGFSDFDNNTDLYKPFLPPVYGELGEYRQLHNVEESVTASALTHLFHRPVTDIVSCISSSYNVYNRNSGIYETYFCGNKEWNNYGTSMKDAFEALGFTNDGIYSNVSYYTFDEHTIYMALSDWDDASESYLTVTWTIAEAQTGFILLDSFSAPDIEAVMEYFSQTTGVYPGFAPEDYERIALLNSLHGTFFLKEPYEAMRDYHDSVDPSERKEFFYTQWQQMIDFIDSGIGDESLVKSMMSSYLRLTCIPMDMKLLSMYKNPADLYPVYEFIEVMGMLNRVIIPSVWGTMFSGNEASQKLNDVTNAILTQRHAEYEKLTADMGE
ncbi:MAG: hypothetical protein H9W81_12545 [Enterococcus sp.]|nr:hypothetical protein [Enterococcus sp.]